MGRVRDGPDGEENGDGAKTHSGNIDEREVGLAPKVIGAGCEATPRRASGILDVGLGPAFLRRSVSNFLKTAE